MAREINEVKTTSCDGRRREGFILGTLLLAALAVGTGASAAENGTFRVMTYNIHHAEGLDQKVELQRIAELIQQEKADIVALQEVDQGTQRTQRRDFPAEFARLTDMSCIFSNNYHFQGGHYGNAVLTRFPVQSVTNTLYKLDRPGEQRGLLQVVLNVAGRELVLMNTHLDFRPDDAERYASVAEIRSILSQYSGKPVVLCGDFNDVPTSRTHQALADLFTDAWSVAGSNEGLTIPARKPTKRIDYIWISKSAQLVPVSIWIPRSEASDHLPVIAELRWK